MTSPLGLDIGGSDWKILEAQRERIQRATDADKAALIDSFNHMITKAFIRNLKEVRCIHEITDKEVDALTPKEALGLLTPHIERVAKLVSLSDRDLNAVVDIQKNLDWDSRCPQLVQELKTKGVHVWGVEELDMVESMTTALLPHYRLAVLKERAIISKEDACAIYYDPKVQQINICSTYAGMTSPIYFFHRNEGV